MKIKVLVADDHELVRHGITRMLDDEADIEVVGEACNGEDAVTMCREYRPNVVLMDVQMPGIGGLEATRKIAQHHPEIKIVIVTACDEDPFPSKLLKAGASGFVTKGAGIDEMIKAVREVMHGKRYLSPQIAQQMALKSFDSDEESPFDQLSERELQICMMVINCHKVPEISDSLCLSPKTVNSYRYRIFEKLDISSDVELTRLAIRYGMLDAEAC